MQVLFSAAKFLFPALLSEVVEVVHSSRTAAQLQPTLRCRDSGPLTKAVIRVFQDALVLADDDLTKKGSTKLLRACRDVAKLTCMLDWTPRDVERAQKDPVEFLSDLLYALVYEVRALLDCCM